jgi:hypothetical protein
MSLLLSNFYPRADAVLVSGNQTITGIKNFINRPTVNSIGVLLQGEAAGGGSIENVVYTTGTQTITGPKNFTARPTFNNLNLITTGDLVNLELNITGLITSSSAFNGNRQIKQVPTASTNYGGTTISGFLENMFFPYIQSTITLNGFSTRTYGYDQVNQLTFDGSINPNPSDDTIIGMQHVFGTTVLSGVSRNTAGSYSTSNVLFTLLAPPPASRTATSSNSFITRLLGTRSGVGFTTDSSAQLLRFEPPYFYGISTNSNLGVNVTGLTPINPSNGLYPSFGINGRPSQINGLQFQFNAQTPNGYIYFAYPDFTNPTDSIAAWGLLNSNNGIQDANNFLDYTSTYTNSTVTLNFTHKSNLTYRIYRSPLLSPVTLPTTFTLNFKYV